MIIPAALQRQPEAASVVASKEEAEPTVSPTMSEKEDAIPHASFCSGVPLCSAVRTRHMQPMYPVETPKMKTAVVGMMS